MSLPILASGEWRDDCLHLEISDGEGGYMEGRFPVLIDPSGENLHISKIGKRAWSLLSSERI